MTNRRFHELFGGPPRQPESRPRAAAHGPGREHPGGDRGGRAARWAASCPRADRHEEPGAGRRRGAQLRRQRPAAARGPVRRHLDSAGGRRRRRRARRGAVRLASAARASRATPTADDASRAACSGRAFADDEICDVPRPGRGAVSRALPTSDDLLRARRRAAGRRARSSAGSRAAWSSARARSARAASSATPRSPKMQATMNLKIKFRESFRPFAPVVLQEHAHRVVRPASRGRRARTCCWSRRCATSTACRSADDAGALMATDPDLRQARERAALDDPGGDARRLQRPRADGGRATGTRGSTGC